MSTALTLWNIEHDLVAWADTLEMVPADAPERAEVAARVAEYLGAAVAKRDRFCEFLQHLESLEAQAKAEEERLAARRRKLVEMRESLEEYAVRAMEATGQTKLEGQLHTLKLRRLPPSVVILDEGKIPASMKRIPPPPAPAPDKAAIKRALLAGEEVPGADLRIGGVKLVRE